MGQKPIAAKNNGVALDSTFQVAEVSKTLGAVIEMVKKGNRVVFDRDENQNCTSEIYNKPTGQRIKINEHRTDFLKLGFTQQGQGVSTWLGNLKILKCSNNRIVSFNACT